MVKRPGYAFIDYVELEIGAAGAFLAHGHHRSSTVWKSQPYDSTMPFANRSECMVSTV